MHTNPPATRHKERTLASRIFQIVLAGNIAVLLVTLGIAWWALEDLEQTFIDSTRSIELEYFAEYGEKDRPLRVHTAQMIAAFQPENTTEPLELPVMFRKLPVPFEGELKLQGKEYLVITHLFPEGTYYLAKSLEAFEQNEEKAIELITMLALSLMVLSLLLAWVASRMIARPVVHFAQDIQTLHPDRLHSRLPENFTDSELNTISRAINSQLARIEDAFARERALVAMASHELRTPIAVISGAVNVLENRNQLQANDKITLERISKASSEMTANIQALLNLVRHTRENRSVQAVYLADVLNALREEYSWVDTSRQQRLDIIVNAAHEPIHADAVLVKMLLHNLISNALNHAQGKVTVTLQHDCIDIADEGIDPQPTTKADTSLPEGFSHSSGMGMYIISLICEALHWQHEITTNDKAGITVKIHFNPGQLTAS